MDDKQEVRAADQSMASGADEAEVVAGETPGVARVKDGQVFMDGSSEEEQTSLDQLIGDEEPQTPELSIDVLQRLKADLENDRKRMMREQTKTLEYATRDLAKRLIPVIDHFRLAIEHGEGGEGIALALKELLDVLAAEGVEEIDVPEGTPFDPQVHNALASQVDPNVEVDTVTKVHRTGYRFKDQVLRSPEVLVAQPPAGGQG